MGSSPIISSSKTCLMASFFVLSHKANFRLHWSNQRSLSLTEKLQFLFALTSTSFFVLSHKANFRLPLEQSAFASCSLKSSSLFSSHPSFISCPYRTRQTFVYHWSNQRSLSLTEKLQFLFLTYLSFFLSLSHKANFRLPLEQSAFAFAH